MTKDEQFTKEASKLLKDAGIKVMTIEGYDGDDNYTGSAYFLVRGRDGAWANLEDVTEQLDR